MAGRGRPKGSTNKKSAPAAAGGPGHNSGQSIEGLDDDRLHALTRHHMLKRAELIAKEKKSKAERMNYDKIIKSDLGTTGLADIKLLEELSDPDNANSEKSLQLEVERKLRVARWAGMAIGDQGDLFGEDKRSQREKGFDLGKRDGLDGKAPKPPYTVGNEGHQGYLEGYHQAQATMASAIKQTPPKEDAAGIIPSTEQSNSGPDSFDQDSDPDTTNVVPPAPEVEQAPVVGEADTKSEPKWPDEVQIESRREADEASEDVGDEQAEEQAEEQPEEEADPEAEFGSANDDVKI